MLPDMLVKAALKLASGSGEEARLSTLIFHRVLAQSDPLFPEEMDAETFDRLCSWLARWFQVLPLSEGVQRLRCGQLPPRALAITFDDGYADNLTVAAPILLRHGLSATVFVAPGYLDGGCMWNDAVIESMRRSPLPTIDLRGLHPELPASLPLSDALTRRQAALHVIGAIKYLVPGERQKLVDALVARAHCELPSDLMMTGAQLTQLHSFGQMSIGAHTLRHPILARLDSASARAEIEGSRDWLQAHLGQPVRCFAYPNGKPGTDYLARDVELVREAGFDFAVSTAWGAASRHSDTAQLPRFTPWDRSPHRFVWRMIRNLKSAPAPVLAMAA